MSEKQKRTGMIVGISAAVVAVVVVVSLFASGALAGMAPKERVVESDITTNEILAIKTNYGHGNSIGVPAEGAGWIFWQLWVEDDVFADVLKIDSVVCSNGTRRIIQMNNAFTGGSNDMNGTTFAFHYLGNWYIHEYAIPEDLVGAPNSTQTLAAIWEIAS